MRNIYKILLLSSCILEASSLYKKDIATISKSFLGKEYKANTLVGSDKIKEKLVINLESLDCFTYIDYVAAFSISSNEEEFKKNLLLLRYKEGKLSYLNRNHFFTDWIKNNSYSNISSLFAKSKTVLKYLNKNKQDVYLKGLEIKKRNLEYLPASSFSKLDYSKFKTGDLIGIYSKKIGLDVTHVGILIKKKNNYYLRHASLRYKKVIDENLKEYLKNKNGLVILRKK